MKRILFLLIFTLFLFGCSNEYRDWKNVKLKEIGNFEVPKSWTCNKDRNIIYFTSEEDSLKPKSESQIIGTITNGGKGIESISKFCGRQIKIIKLKKSQVFSNNAIAANVCIELDGHLCEVNTLWLNSTKKSAYFIAFDDKIKYELILKMAESFSFDKR